MAISVCLSQRAQQFTGLWATNAPKWMWLALFVWWVGLIFYFIKMQMRGKTFDTYQAHWGTDPNLAGNKIKPIGYGIRRVEKGE